MKKRSIKKLFPVLINDIIYHVFDIDGKEHDGLNDTPKTWWLYHADIDLTKHEPLLSANCWEPWTVGILRQCWDISIKQSNSVKHKWGQSDFRNSLRVEMWCNSKLVYAFTSGGGYLDFAMAKIQTLKVLLNEHPYDFFDSEIENGRLIYYHGMPATIKVNEINSWEIGIVPDYTCGLAKDAWWSELDRRSSLLYDFSDDTMVAIDYTDEQKENDYINFGDALEAHAINWFRTPPPF